MTQRPQDSPSAASTGGSVPAAVRAPEPQVTSTPLPGEPQLMQRLAVADQQWRPRREALPNGGSRYTYRKRPGDPDLSVAQIKALIANPPTFERERRSIVTLWRHLGQLGVRLQLEQPRKAGAAGEWDPGARTLRIKPAVVAKGSSEFARVLNHEAIHVAQSDARELQLEREAYANQHQLELGFTLLKMHC